MSSMELFASFIDSATDCPKLLIPLPAPDIELDTLFPNSCAVLAASPTDELKVPREEAACPTEDENSEANLPTDVPEKALSTARPTLFICFSAELAARPIAANLELAWSFIRMVAVISDIQMLLLP